MAEQKPKPCFCPNCGKPAIKAGKEVTCEACDAIFTVSEKSGAIVKQIGIEQRIKQLEDAVFKPAQEPAEPEPEPEPEPDQTQGNEEEEEIFPR